MKAKGLRKILAGIMSLAMCISGGIAISSLNATNAKANTSTPIQVSSDIQKIIDGYATRTYSGIKMNVEYVENQTLNNGTTGINGIKFTIENIGSVEYEGELYPNFTVDVSSFTGNDAYWGAIYAPDGGNQSAHERMEVYLRNVDEKYALSARTGFDGTQTFRVWKSGYGQNGVGTIGVYNPTDASKVYNFNTGKTYAKTDGSMTKPFNYYYDYATNVVYKDTSNGNGVDGVDAIDKYRLGQILNLNPTNFGSVDSSLIEPYSAGVTLRNYTGAATQFPFEGLRNGKAYIGFRPNIKVGKSMSFILTSYAGLDLTNKNNTFGEDCKVLFAENDNAFKGVDYTIPTAEFTTPFGDEITTAQFDGKVNVYKGSRAYKFAYGSIGASVASIANDTGLTVTEYVNKSVGDKIIFDEAGVYTLEYVDNQGYTAYKTVNVTFDPEATNVIGSVTIDDLLSNLQADGVTFTKNSSVEASGSGVTFNGVKVDVTNNTVVNYAKPINLQSFFYNTKSDNAPIIGLVPTPNTAYTGGNIPTTIEAYGQAVANGTLPEFNSEFEYIEIVLTDVHDATSKIHVRITCNPHPDAAPDGPRDNGTTYKGALVDVWADKDGVSTGNVGYNKGYGVRFGAVRNFSYMGYSTEAFKLIYDYDKNAIYSSVDGDKNSNVTNSYLLKMFGVPAKDYDKYVDPDNGGNYKACSLDERKNQTTWNGFTNGDVNLSIEFKLKTGVSKGTVVMTNLLGLDLTGGQTSFDVKSYKDHCSDEALNEYTPAGEIVVPKITLKNTFIENYSRSYEGKVVVMHNGTKIDTVNAGDKYDLNKPGKYDFVYDLGARKFIHTTKVKAGVKFVINGSASVEIDGQKYFNGDVYLTDKDFDFAEKISQNWYFINSSLVDEATQSAIDYVKTENEGSIAIDNLTISNVYTVTVRENYTLNYYVQNKLYDTKIIKQGENAVIPSVNPSVTGYTFSTWLKDGVEFGGDDLLPITDTYGAEVYNVKAYLIPINYTATLVLDKSFDGMATMPSASGVFNIESSLDGFAKPTIDATNGAGYVFGGWYYNGKLITSGSDLPSQDVTVYAYLTNEHFTITYKEFNSQGKVIVVGTSDVVVGEKVSAKEFSKDGYVLEGWYTDVACTQKYNFGQTLSDDVELYANWVKVGDDMVDGVNQELVKPSTDIVTNVETGAFNKIDGLGITSIILAVVGLIATIVMAVLVILKLKK